MLLLQNRIHTTRQTKKEEWVAFKWGLFENTIANGICI